MGKKIVIIGMLLLSISNYGQSLQGIVTDKKTGVFIPYATVVLKDQKGKFLKGEITDEKGRFMLKEKAGPYKVEVSFIGYKTYFSDVEIKNNTSLDIPLLEDANTLNEVVVSAEKTTVKQLIDKKVITVGNDLLANGGDATTVLGQLSEIQIDQHGGISLRGNSNVNVLIDGKPSPMSVSELLQEIPAEDIHKVEVITSPSVKYSANGLTGIINIITKRKVREGVSVNVRTNLNSIGTSGVGGSVTYGVSKMNYHFGSSYRRAIYKGNNLQQRFDANPFTQEGIFRFDGNIYRANTGIDWFVDKFNEFSLHANYTDNGHDIRNGNTVYQNNEIFRQDNLEVHSHRTFKINGNYRHVFENEQDFLEIDIDVSNNKNKLQSYFKPYVNVFDNLTNNNVEILNISADYSGTLSERIKVEAGALWLQHNLINNRNFFNADAEVIAQDNFENLQSTYATYLLSKFSFEKLKIQTGLRYEYFTRQANLLSDNSALTVDYTNLFPSIHTSYHLNDHHIFTLGYNRRTSRPSLWQLNPVTLQTSEFSFRQGNPNLQPEFSDNLDVSYQFTKKGLSIIPSFSYIRTVDVITGYNFIKDNTIRVNSFINSLFPENAFGAQLSVSVKPVRWLTTDASLFWNYASLPERLEGLKRNYKKSNSLTLRNQFKLHQKANLLVSFDYRGENISYNNQTEAILGMSMAFRYKIMKNKGKLNLRIDDIFDSRRFRGESHGVGFSQAYDNKYVTRLASVSFVYNFSGGGIKKRSKKSRKYQSGLVH